MNRDNWNKIEFCERTWVISRLNRSFTELHESFSDQVVDMLKTVPGISHADHEGGMITAIYLEKGAKKADVINQPHLALRVLSVLPLENWHSLFTPHN